MIELKDIQNLKENEATEEEIKLAVLWIAFVMTKKGTHNLDMNIPFDGKVGQIRISLHDLS